MPEIVNVRSPRGVVGEMVMVNVEEVPVVGSELKLEVAPVGSPLTARSTDPVKFVRAKFMV